MNNNEAWNRLFDKYEIYQKVRNEGAFLIKADQIKEFREPRLMTKFDFTANIPKPFIEFDYPLSILPVSRNEYMISNFKTHFEFANSRPTVERFEFPSFFETLVPENITSESTALLCALHGNLLANFLEEEVKLTINGRMGSGKFDFEIQTHNSTSLNINVNGSQIEIDGGYEGESSICLIEAKNSVPDDFLIRQLFYPYKTWLPKVKKKIRPVFLTYSNGIFHISEFVFEDSNNYNSIRLVKEKRFVFGRIEINHEVVKKILDSSKLVPEPINIPFPQADSFERLISICELLYNEGSLTKAQLKESSTIVERQIDYYFNSVQYLGLAKSNKIQNVNRLSLSDLGLRIFSSDLSKRNILIIELLCSFQVFNNALKQYYLEMEKPSKDFIVKTMIESNLSNMNETTMNRRASTVASWCSWVVETASLYG